VKRLVRAQSFWHGMDHVCLIVPLIFEELMMIILCLVSILAKKVNTCIGIGLAYLLVLGLSKKLLIAFQHQEIPISTAQNPVVILDTIILQTLHVLILVIMMELPITMVCFIVNIHALNLNTFTRIIRVIRAAILLT